MTDKIANADRNSFIEVEFSDGTSARWSATDREADIIAALIEDKIGPPDTVKV